VLMPRQPIGGSSVWLGRDIAGSRRWIRDLEDEHLAVLDHALAEVKRCGLAWHEIRREDFPLDAMAGLIADIAAELEDGCGMVKLRGFPVAHYDTEDVRRLYFGLGAWLGTPVFQNRSGELMRAIRDEGASVGQRYGQIEGKT